MIKFQRDGIAVQDNTKVIRKQPLAFRLTKEQQTRIKQRKLQEAVKRNQVVIYDTDKAKYYQILISKLSQVGLVRDLLLKMEVNLNLNSF